MKKTHFVGVWKEEKGRNTYIYTKNLLPGQRVYEERLRKVDKIEYRQWDPSRSKLAAGILKKIQFTGIKEKDKVLYLGSSNGTTVSHVSDIVGEKGVVYGVEFAQRVMRDFVFLAEKRKNIIPIFESANHPEKYQTIVNEVDMLFMDIAQRDQPEIFIKNLRFLKKGGYAIIAIKARSIDVARKPERIYNEVEQKLKKELEVIEMKILDPFEVDHAMFICKKR